MPDGNRRLVLALTDLVEGSTAFHHTLAELSARLLLDNLRVFFDHGLPVLFVPLLSQSAIDRSASYQCEAVLEGLRLLFASAEWDQFYAKFKVRVRVYGAPAYLAQTPCATALDWIRQAEARTAHCQSHRLFFGIGGTPWVGADVLSAATAFSATAGRAPTGDEATVALYGELVEPAEFCILSSKLAGLGALPGLITGRDTQLYIVPGPGVWGLTAATYRAILYDLLFLRAGSEMGDYAPSPADRQALRAYFETSRGHVLGIGRQIGRAWVPMCPDWEGFGQPENADIGQEHD
ncbi:MAG: hypothetical protein KKA73_05105 [Chloroflexi bacterium]|nr:hypothetical protein [Chloroflexota bacterium]MBU1747046.1 hypothetical protein [Chloroflexota bacterium]